MTVQTTTTTSESGKTYIPPQATSSAASLAQESRVASETGNVNILESSKPVLNEKATDSKTKSSTNTSTKVNMDSSADISTNINLRDALLSALSTLPGKRTFHVHALVSAPRKYGSALFPYASPRLRVYAQDILVLCSEDVDSVSGKDDKHDGTASATTTATATSTSTSGTVLNDNNLKESDGSSKTDIGQEQERIFVTAISATLFRIPATRSAILYIAKVDSTGQGASRPVPSPTRTLVHTLIQHVVRNERRAGASRMWVHVFARAERQYLFPNSGDHPRKAALTDVRLCRWWRALLAGAAREVVVVDGGGGNGGGESTSTAAGVRMWYILPGLNAIEAMQSLGVDSGSSSSSSLKWEYGHPYSQRMIPLPYVTATKEGKHRDGRENLGQLVPSFDDDPKSRFMDEIACTVEGAGVPSPQRKRRRTQGEEERGGASAEKLSSNTTTTTTTAGSSSSGGGSNGKNNNGATGKGKKGGEDERVHGELGVVSADEFWERMSFRQECVAGAVTGFFVLCFELSPGLTKPENSSTLLNRYLTPLAPMPGEVSHDVVRRVLSSLMERVEFSTTEAARAGTGIIERLIAGLCGGLQVRREREEEKVVTVLRPPPAFERAPETPTRRPRGLPLVEPEAVEVTVPKDQETLQKEDVAQETLEVAPQTPPRVELVLASSPPHTPRTPARRVPLTPSEGGLGSLFSTMAAEESPLAFAEPVPSRAAYEAHVYGWVEVDRPVEMQEGKEAGGGGAGLGKGTGAGAGAGVTVLAVRKKKRK